MHVAARSVWLAVAWAFLAATPLAVAGLCEGAWSPRAALAGALGLAVTALPLLWVSLGSSERGAAVRVCELLLLLAAGLPALTLATAFSGVDDAAALRAALYALGVVLLVGAVLARTDAAQRPSRFALCAAWVAGAPLALLLWTDVAGAPSVALAPLLALSTLLDGASASAPAAALVLFALAFLSVEVAVAVRARRGPTPSLVTALLLAVGLGLGLTGPSDAQDPPSVRAVLGAHVRPGDPYPLRVRATGNELLAAGSYRHRFSARVSGAGGLAPTPVGSGRRLELLRGNADGGWRRMEVVIPEPAVVSPQTLLVGTLGAGVEERARQWFPRSGAVMIPLEAADLALVAQAGEALDVIVAAPGIVRNESATHLRAWAAAGGTLVLADPSDMTRAAGALAAAGASTDGVRMRPIGSGVLVGDLTPGALPQGVRDRLADRLRRRARRGAIQAAVLNAPAPVMSRELARQGALASLAVAFCFVLLAPLRRRVGVGGFVGGAALVGLLLALAVKAVAAPPVPVFAESRTILEAPAGARAAGRLRIVTCAASKPTTARVTLIGRAVPRPVFAASQDAVLAEVAIHSDADRAFLELPLRRTARTFVRQDAADLGGVFRLTRGAGGRQIRIENRSPLALRDAFALVRGGLYPLDDLAPGQTQELDLLTPPIPFRRWRLSALDRATRSWRQLVTAALTGRDLEGSLLLIGRTDGDAQVSDGVAEERVQPPLIVITASQETL